MSATGEHGRRDFFISHAGADQQWAEWIGQQLVDAGYAVELDVWEWAPGDDFVAAMQAALERADRVLAVYTKNYFARPFAQAEHHAAFTAAMTGRPGRIVPVRVEPCEVPELYAALIRIELADLDEAEAARRLLRGVAKPTGPPVDPITYPARPGRISPIESTGLVGFPRRLPSVWNMPPRNPYFTGRAGLLGEMHRRLHAAGTAVAILPLQGMSGVGKSQLAVEYAHRHAAEFQLAWWVNAENRIVAASGLLELAEALGLPSGAQPTVLRQLWAALGERDDWLLVYDNVIDPAGLTVLRPPDTGRLLITGRSPLIGRLSTVVEVAEFSRDESIALLRLRCPTLSDEGADQVAAALGDLPLAVEQAGCYLADTGLEVSDYLRLLATQPAEAGLAEGTVDRHPGLASVVTASRVRLQALDPRAAALLDQLAFFAAEPLPLVPYYRDQQSHRFGVQIGDAAKTGAVVREITRLGLAHHRGTTIQLHRLVQALLRARLSATEQAISRHAAQQVVGSANPGTPDDPTSWPAYATLTPHVQALIEPSELNGAALEPEPDQFRTLFLNITRYLFLSGQYLVGRDLASYAHRHWSQTLGPDHPDALHASNRLAAVLSGLGDYETACELLTDALTRRRRVLGDDHIDTIGSANNLAIVMGRLGEYAGARDLLQDTIERQRRVLGDDHPATLYSVNNLADTLYWLGDYAAARDLLDDTIALRRQVLGVEDPHTLYSAASLAEVLGALGEYASARDVLKDVLPRQRRVVGPDHPDTLYSTGVLAKVLSGLGELAAAREVLTDTLIRQRRLLGNDHPDTRKTEDDLAQLEPALSPSPLDDEESTRSGPREQ